MNPMFNKNGGIIKNTTLASLQTDEEFFSYLKTVLLQSKLELQPTINYQTIHLFQIYYYQMMPIVRKNINIYVTMKIKLRKRKKNFLIYM